MPFLSAISKIDFPKVQQAEVKRRAREFFAPSFPQIDRIISAFDNADIESRNFCRPIDTYLSLGTFQQRNKAYVDITMQYSEQAIEECISADGINKGDITDIIFVSTTGMATPSPDALLINHMRLPVNINRLPVFGLGCAGGVSGFAKACTLARANPKAVILLVVVELCSLTFLNNDFSKSNFIASTLFSDGVVALLIKGDEHGNKASARINFLASQSKLYYDSLGVMGWEFLNDGLKVIFSQDIPTIIEQNVKGDITAFLSKHDLQIEDIKNFIFHPGGKKVLTAYENALQIEGDFLRNTRTVMNLYGNMSSATVLYVLERFFTGGFEDGYGLMCSLGPGFSSEMALVEMVNG